MTQYSILNLSKRFGELLVLDRVSFDFSPSSITAILGPSGCGKTTLLNIIAGMTPFDAGTIDIPIARTCSYCFQEPRLLDWLTAEDNMRYALSGLNDRDNVELRIQRFLREAGLEEFKRYFPPQLSGGMQKRLALARAFAFPAELLLLDEAFSAIDLRQKRELMNAFLNLWKEEKPTVLLVTHDIYDALLLADRVIVLSARPGQVRGMIDISVAQTSRRFADEEMARIERALYDLIDVPARENNR
ncbi:MAG: ABC transporter ATP-binding protein [Rectinema sp.]|nr:ABC transporter ATP-binding protein [Rectinema sp.]